MIVKKYNIYKYSRRGGSEGDREEISRDKKVFFFNYIIIENMVNIVICCWVVGRLSKKYGKKFLLGIVISN